MAAPGLLDPNFFRTVVLILEHSIEEGAIGVVLNRPTDHDLVTAMPEWTSCAAAPPVVFVGGPVSVTSAICLGLVAGDITVVDANRDPDETEADEVRFFAGYAGWSAGQLEDELDEGSWIVLDAEPGDALDADPDGLWRRVLERQGGDLALLAKYPEDPSTN